MCLHSSHVTQPEGLVSIAPRMSNAKVISHQQEEVWPGGCMAPGLTQEQQQKHKDPHLPAKGKGKREVKDTSMRWTIHLLL